jgi:hypothetical protein
MIQRMVKILFGRFGFKILDSCGWYNHDGLFTVHSDHFRLDPEFRRAYERGLEAGAGVDPDFEWRVHVALWAAQTALRVEGCFIECGVNSGFISSAIMKKLDWRSVARPFYLIDTFGGPVLSQFSSEEAECGNVDAVRNVLKQGGYVTDMSRIRANFAEWPGCVVVQGEVPSVLESINTGSVAFLHLDMNCAYPEVKALEFFWDRLSPGGVVLLDDYAYHGYEYQRKALDAVIRARRGHILSLPTGQGLIVK